MDVKGKGKMSTYFLCGHLQRRMEELEDGFSSLDTYQDGTENGEYVVGPSGLSQDDLVSLDTAGDGAGKEGGGDALDTTFEKDDISGEEDAEDGEEDAEGSNGISCDEEEQQSDNTVDEKIDEGEKEWKGRRESAALESASEKVEVARRKISSQSLASGSAQNDGGAARKLKRGNRKISRSCNDAALFNTTLTLPQPRSGHRSASEDGIAEAASKGQFKRKDKFESSAANDNECIYVNGSFKNAYRNVSATERDTETGVFNDILESSSPVATDANPSICNNARPPHAIAVAGSETADCIHHNNDSQIRPRLRPNPNSTY